MKLLKKSSIVFLFLFFGFTIQAQTDSNKLDENGKKEGLWKGFYPDSKRVRYQGTFSHGQEVGLFQFFDDTKLGSVIATREFNAKDNSCYTTFYDQKKNKVSEGKLVNRLNEGEWKYYHHASPVVMTTENYKNGKLEGLRSVFFLNGKLAEQAMYKNDLKNGLYKKFSEEGILYEESNYKDNEFDGLATFYDATGLIVSKGMFAKGKKVGMWDTYVNGKLVGPTNMNFPKKKDKLKIKVK